VTPPLFDRRSERFRVLLVEPDPGDAELVQLWLRSARESRYDVWHVETLGDAEGCLAKAGFDLALVDLSLPDAPGPWAVQSLRERHPELPVIVFSSFAESDVGARLVAEGARDHLVKGQMNGDTLVRAMRHGVEYGRMARELRAARQTAEDAARDRSELVAELAEELRTPILTSLGVADLLLETELTREQEGYVRSFVRSGENVLARMDGLLGGDGCEDHDRAERERAAAAASTPSLAAEAGLRVLVVDDDGETRDRFMACLRRGGHAVEGAADGLAAAARFCDGDFDLVLMDLQMPGCDGLEATRTIRRWESDAGQAPVPILAVTGRARPEDVRGCLEAGCDDHLAKPVDDDALLAAVARHAPKHHGRLLKVDGASVEEIDLYLHERHNDLAGLRLALEARDFDAVQTVARDLERSAEAQGFAELAGLGRALRGAADARDADVVERGIADLGDFLREVKIIVG